MAGLELFQKLKVLPVRFNLLLKAELNGIANGYKSNNKTPLEAKSNR